MDAENKGAKRTMNAGLLRALERLDQGQSVGDKVSLLRDLRRSKLRRPDVVLKLADGARAQATRGSVEELNLFEQVSLASMDLGETSLLAQFMQLLAARVGGGIEATASSSAPSSSSRLDRLRGMKLESEGKFGEAIELYAEVLKKNPSNMLVMKRIACVYRQQGQIQEAVEELHKILKLFSSDSTTWLELSEIHLSRGEYAEAAHCLEELVMLDPDCAHVHARLADTYYTIGGAEYLLLARKHYTFSLNRQNAPINLRAHYGLVATCRALLELPDLPGGAAQKDVTRALLDLGRDTAEKMSGTVAKL